jgi:hypothetical protein
MCISLWYVKGLLGNLMFIVPYILVIYIYIYIYIYSIASPTTCTRIFYVFFITLYLLYVFRVLFAPIIRSTLKCEGVPAATCSNGLSSFQHTITITRNNGCTLQFVFLMMGANSTRNMYNKYSVIKNT